jgi:hypothetical protein
MAPLLDDGLLRVLGKGDIDPRAQVREEVRGRVRCARRAGKRMDRGHGKTIHDAAAFGYGPLGSTADPPGVVDRHPWVGAGSPVRFGPWERWSRTPAATMPSPRF